MMCMPFSLKEQQAFETGGQKYRSAMLRRKNRTRTRNSKELYYFHLLSVVFDIKFTWNVITGDVIPTTKRNSIIGQMHW